MDGSDLQPAHDPQASAPTAPQIVPLADAPNYILLKKAAAGALDGSISPEEYAAIVKKIRQLHATGLKIIASDVAMRMFENISAEQKEARDSMEDGFRKIHDGMTRMEAYLSSHDPQDVIEGAALAEAGYERVQWSEERAIALDPARHARSEG